MAVSIESGGTPTRRAVINPLRIVIADDSDLFRRELVALVEGVIGAVVVGEARDGFEALDVVGRVRPDVLLLDLQMERMHGLEVSRRLRAAQDSVSIAVLTIHDSPAVRRACQEAGADGFVPKNELRARLASLLQALFPDRVSVVGGDSRPRVPAGF